MVLRNSCVLLLIMCYFYLRAHKKRNLKLISEDKLVPATLLCLHLPDTQSLLTLWCKLSSSGVKGSLTLSVPSPCPGSRHSTLWELSSLPPPPCQNLSPSKSDSRSFHFRKTPKKLRPERGGCCAGRRVGTKGGPRPLLDCSFIHWTGTYLILHWADMEPGSIVF